MPKTPVKVIRLDKFVLALLVIAVILFFLSFAGVYVAFSKPPSKGAAFVYKGTDTDPKWGQIVWVQPMLVPSIGLRQIKGPKEFNKHDILFGCKQGEIEHKAKDEQGDLVFSSATLTCSDGREFEILGIYFETDTEEKKETQ